MLVIIIDNICNKRDTNALTQEEVDTQESRESYIILCYNHSIYSDTIVIIINLTTYNYIIVITNHLNVQQVIMQ